MRNKRLSFLFTSPLRDKIFIMFLLMAAVPTLLLGWLTILFLDETHRHDVEIIEEEALHAVEEEVKKYFSNIIGILDLRLEAINEKEVSAEHVSWQKQLAEAMRKAHDGFVEITFVSPEGKEAARASRDKREGPLLYVSDLPAFQVARSGQPYIGEVYYTNAGPRITLASPVRAEGAVVQVVIAEADITALVRSVTAYRFGATGYMVLADSRNAYVGIESLGSVKPGDNITPLLKHAATENRYESVFSNTPVAVAIAPISMVNWTLVAEWPLVEADAVMNDIRNQIVLVVLVSMFGVVLLAPLFATRIVQPIRALEKGAQRIEQGDFDAVVAISTKDELEELGTTFNKMAKGLKRLQELKNEFVFIAAHELRAPVTAVKGYLSMIFEGSAGAIPEKMREYLTPVQKANERLVGLVDELLEVARSEAGRLTVTCTSLDIRESVSAVMEEAAALAAEKHITLTYEKLSDMPLVLMDTGRVKEVVMNFVSNAIKYNHDGGFVRVYHEVKPKLVVTHVEDNGFGMSAEAAKHMFEKFFRAETEQTKLVKGTGLGLFITKELVEKMGGTVSFRSKEGKGSRFSFSLQRASPKAYTGGAGV